MATVLYSVSLLSLATIESAISWLTVDSLHGLVNGEQRVSESDESEGRDGERERKEWVSLEGRGREKECEQVIRRYRPCSRFSNVP